MPRVMMMKVTQRHLDAIPSYHDMNYHQKLSEGWDQVRDAFIGSKYEERVLRILVTPEYLPLKAVENVDEFKTVFKHVVKGG